MRNLLNYIGRVLCLCLPLALVGCGDERFAYGCGQVEQIGAHSDGSCWCELNVCHNDHVSQQVWVDCPCSTNLGDTLINP